MDVVLVRWPAERFPDGTVSKSRITSACFSSMGRPPPVTADLFEDWVATPG